MPTDRAQDTEAIRAAIKHAAGTPEATDARLDAFQALDRLVARLEAAERAVAFYAAESTYQEGTEPHPRHFATGVVPIEADLGARARAALAAAAPGETTRGGLIHTPTKRVMGVDAPDFGDPIGDAAPGETGQTP